MLIILSLFDKIGFMEAKRETANFFPIEETRRHGSWLIEVPRTEDPNDAVMFTRVAQKVIPEALEECHPLVRRKATIVQFPERMIIKDEDNVAMMRIAGRNCFGQSPRSISLSMENLKNRGKIANSAGWHINALHILLHELFEEDYREKSVEPVKTASLLDPNYFTAEHEQIANKRAKAQLERTLGMQYEMETLEI